MNMPGFTAEASLPKTGELYHWLRPPPRGATHGVVSPQVSPLSSSPLSPQTRR